MWRPYHGAAPPRPPLPPPPVPLPHHPLLPPVLQVGLLPKLCALKLVGPFQLDVRALSDNAEGLSRLTKLSFEGRCVGVCVKGGGPDGGGGKRGGEYTGCPSQLTMLSFEGRCGGVCVAGGGRQGFGFTRGL